MVAQKVRIAEDIANVMAQFGDLCSSIKSQLFQQLDDFLKYYSDSFTNYKEMFEDTFSLTNKFQYFNNLNNLIAKLHSTLPGQVPNFLLDLRKSIEKAKVVNGNRSAFISYITKISQNLNKMMDNLPNYQTVENFDSLMQKIYKDIEGTFNKNLHIENLKELHVQRDFMENIKRSSNNFNIVSDNKHLMILSNTQQMEQDEISVKPIKKYQLDFPITGITALSDIHLALVSSQDTKIRIFESNQKKMQQVAGHSQPVTFISKVITEERLVSKSDKILQGNKNLSNLPYPPYSQPNAEGLPVGGKRVLLASCSMDLSVILWSFDYDMKQNPAIYQKLIGFSSSPCCLLDLEDNFSVAAGDLMGELTVWDYHRSQIIFANKGTHNGKITCMSVYKRMEKFIAGSEDNVISVWKIKYTNPVSGLPSYPESFACENVYKDNFGGITSFQIPICEPHLIFIGNMQGMLKLYDLSKKSFVADTMAHQNSPVLDMGLAEGKTKENQPSLSLLSFG